MANEQNYTIEVLRNDNQVDEAFACPACHNDDADMLYIDKHDRIRCLECGCEYTINA